MHAFEFHVPTRIIFGRDAELQAAAQIKAEGGTHVMVVYGGHSAVKSGLLDRVLAGLKEEGLPCETLGGVRPNPRLSLAREGVEKARAAGVDFLLAVGGGSVIDTAKAIADSIGTGEDPWLLMTKEKPVTGALPVGVVLTIPAAGSETSDSCVITNDETQQKRGLSSPFHRPRFAIMNPELAATLPRYQVACGVVDIMMHTMDRYFNPVTDNGLTDEIAEGVLRTAVRVGPRAVAHPEDYDAMSELMWAGSISHNGLTGLGNKVDFAPHQLGHELSAAFDSAHGATLSAVWDSWARYCVDTDPARFARFGRSVWRLNTEGRPDREAALEAIRATAEFFRSLDMPTCLGELQGCGVLTEEQLKELALRCTFGLKRTIGTYKVLGYDDILAIYRMANR